MRAMSDASDEKSDRVSLQSMPPRLDSDSDDGNGDSDDDNGSDAAASAVVTLPPDTMLRVLFAKLLRGRCHLAAMLLPQ